MLKVKKEQLISNSFRYYTSFGDFMRDFDRGLPKYQYQLLLIFFGILYYTRLHVLINFFWGGELEKKKIYSSDIVAFVYGANHKTIYCQLYDMGLKYPVYDFSGKGIEGHEASVFSSRLIFTAAAINAKQTFIELKKAKTNAVLFRNAIRIVKLSGEMFIYDEVLNGVKVIVKYNDHGPDVILLSDMAEERNIKTVYIQHAPVNDTFPPLYHDLNVLFSQSSIDSYKVERESAQKFILFDVRFAERKICPIAANNNTILICTNDQDDIEVVKAFACKLKDKFNVILRPHPGDRRNWAGGDYQISTNKSVWNDIDLAKYVLANESGVLLEGVYADRLCYKCAFFSPSFDNYGFLEKRLILQEYSSEATLINDIENDVIATDKSKLLYFIGQTDQKEKRLKELENEILDLRS